MRGLGRGGRPPEMVYGAPFIGGLHQVFQQGYQQPGYKGTLLGMMPRGCDNPWDKSQCFKHRFGLCIN